MAGNSSNGRFPISSMQRQSLILARTVSAAQSACPCILIGARMSDPQLGSVQEGRILIVEDEYIIAFDLTRSLEELGIQVVGPAAGVAEALRLVVTDGDRLNGAILDINLRGERVYQVAQALAARGVPFMFATGYETSTIP